ncbi:MAG: OmpA family protein, partial [Bacteroidales bacterium]
STPAVSATSVSVSDKPAAFGSSGFASRRPTAGAASSESVASISSGSTPASSSTPAVSATSVSVSDKPAAFGSSGFASRRSGGSSESVVSSSSSTFPVSVDSTSVSVATASSQSASPSNLSAARSFSRAESTTKSVTLSTSGVRQLEARRIISQRDLVFAPIYFQYNSPYVEKKSFYNVAKLINFLKDNPDVTVHLDAFSDAHGSQDVKAKVSERRARVLKQYLKDNGIDIRRVTTAAHGDAMLVNKCIDGVDCSPSEHAKNRRVEISLKESSK